MDALVGIGSVFHLLLLVFFDHGGIEELIIERSKVAWMLHSDRERVLVLDDTSHHRRETFDADSLVIITVDCGVEIGLCAIVFMTDQA
jgi:hypothetical protein